MKRASVGFLIAFILACSFFMLREGQGHLPENPISVMTFNVGTLDFSRPDMDVVGKVISKSGIPDILFLQEVPGKESACKLSESLQLEYCMYIPCRSVKNGLAVISRFPLSKIKSFDSEAHAVVAAEAEIAGRKYLLCSVHLMRIKDVRVTDAGIEVGMLAALGLFEREIMRETPRSRSVEKLLSWLSTQDYRNVIIGGDFNTVPFSRAIRRMEAKFKDALWPSLAYFTGSYNMAPLPIAPRIDYIFYSPGIKCLSAGIIKESAGDHYPIKAVFDPHLGEMGI
jgi:endonuclease/exonuclease/phosphatase family metal-dependent hydrolase